MDRPRRKIKRLLIQVKFKIDGKTEENKKIMIEIEAVVVKDLAAKMGLKVTDLIAELMKNKIFATLNEKIDFETAADRWR